MTIPTKCLVDLDDVLADFVGAACRFYGKNPYETLRGAEHWKMAPLFGMSGEDFFKPFDRYFWANLDPLPWFDDILGLLEEYVGLHNVAICTSPIDMDGCVDGKRDWIKKHLPAFRGRVMYCSAKHFAASPNSILIDDCQANVKAFIEHGGNGYIVGRPWNDNWHGEPHIVEHLEFYLQETLKDEPYGPAGIKYLCAV